MGDGNGGKIRIGIVGLGRGGSFMGRANDALGLELAAICDVRKERLEQVAAQKGVRGYTDYDEFLGHDMDAVVLANFFHEHAPLAIKALKAGKHVLSETACNSTLAEGVELCRAVEASGKVYMLAENYPFTAFNQEMKFLYEQGEIGEVTYAEGEYNHPMRFGDWISIAPGYDHWRNWIPSTYYCTHALAPLMHVTGRMPKRVIGLSLGFEELTAGTTRMDDPGSVILCRMDNGSVFRLFGLTMPGHSNWYRLHGLRGAMETVRGPGYFGPEMVRVWHEEWDLKPGEPVERTWKPGWREHADLARAAGHGGGDFWVNHAFATAIREGRQPWLDVYRGVAMSSVGILAWRSALEEGKPFDMPDFRDEASRKAVEDDRWSPFPGTPDEWRLPARADRKVPTLSEETRKLAEGIWGKK
jgi:predicted dehydrogenase